MSTLRLKIKEVENVKATRRHIKAKLTWKQKYCIITKDFFIAIKPKPNKVGISTLKDDVKAITTNQIKMEWICYNFYNKLYKAQEYHFGNKELRHKVFNFLLIIFCEGMNKKFVTFVSLEEL
jgi:predicted nucleotide-binding protein (sugar kinase/HSP70/actin superfamily)